MYRNNIPSRDQWVELLSECTWEWEGTGNVITGANGNSIFLPAPGYKTFGDSITEIGEYGDYWTSTGEGVENSWYVSFYPDAKEVGFCSPLYQMSVRLVR